MSEKPEETIIINQPVNAPAYRKIKAFAAINKKPIAEVVNNAIIEFAAKIKL